LNSSKDLNSKKLELEFKLELRLESDGKIDQKKGKKYGIGPKFGSCVFVVAKFLSALKIAQL
jgi:hypothetical protein